LAETRGVGRPRSTLDDLVGRQCEDVAALEEQAGATPMAQKKDGWLAAWHRLKRSPLQFWTDAAVVSTSRRAEHDRQGTENFSHGRLQQRSTPF